MENSEGIDQLALNNLEEKFGFTLEGERLVDFYLYFPEEYQALHAAASLINLQFDTELSYSEYDKLWLCLARKRINMTDDRLTDLRNWIEELAEKNGGKYDGWETMISPDEAN